MAFPTVYYSCQLIIPTLASCQNFRGHTNFKQTLKIPVMVDEMQSNSFWSRAGKAISGIAALNGLKLLMTSSTIHLSIVPTSSVTFSLSFDTSTFAVVLVGKCVSIKSPMVSSTVFILLPISIAKPLDLYSFLTNFPCHSRLFISFLGADCFL